MASGNARRNADRLSKACGMVVFLMNATAASTTAPPIETCQERRRAAKATVMLNRASALVRRAGATSGARSARLLREASSIRHVEAEATRLHEARA